MTTLPMPREKAPELEATLTDGDRWELSEQSPENFTMVVFYRGLHCPVCKTYLQTLRDLKDDYAELGVTIAAFSMDDVERARKTVKKWEVDELTVGSIDERTATAWGLYLSSGLEDNDDEPARFSEPGLFLIRPNGELYYAAINSMPFGRPDPEDMKKAIEFVLKKEYPARGVLAA